MISAIVLAAGKSERMGRPKALLLYHGKTFLENVMDCIRDAGIQETLVVVGHHRDEIVSRVTVPRWVFNADYPKGMGTSLQAGIRALPPDATSAMVFLVDHPAVEVNTVRLLIGAAGQKPIVIPTYAGRRGHPALFSREILDEILALPPDVGANTVVRRDPGRVLEIPQESAGVVVDVDTPDQFQSLSDDQL